MAEMTIGAAIGWLARQQPAAVAVRCADEVLTRAELDAVTDRIARTWVADGLRTDDLVSIGLPTGVDLVLATVATWKAGATPMPLSPRLAPAERAAILDLARPARVVTELDRHPEADARDLPALPDVAAACWKAPTSSGSTGRPKIIRAAAPARVDPEGRVADFVPRHAVQLVAAPLWHAAPFVYAMRGLMTGHELVVMERFDPEEWLRLAEEHGVTWGMLVPTMMQRIWRAPARTSYDLSRLEAVLHLGARCPDWLKRAWIGWLGPARVTELYAGTESAGLAFIGGAQWLERPGSVGRPTGGSVFRVVRPDGTDADPGEQGELLMRRPGPTYSYLGPPNAGPDSGPDSGPDASRDGWHSLGDAGWLDADGFVYVADRLDDVIVTGGVKVQPADVEAVLDEHPRVRSSVVVGRPDEDLGERVHAVVDTGSEHVGVEDLQEWVLARLDPEKRPRSWQLVTEPLRADTGKVRRADWR